MFVSQLGHWDVWGELAHFKWLFNLPSQSLRLGIKVSTGLYDVHVYLTVDYTCMYMTF